MGGFEIGLSPDILDGLKKPAVLAGQGIARQGVTRRHNVLPWLYQAQPACTFGSSDNAFGTPGAGGSFGFADPDTGIGFGYVMNKPGFHLVSDPRELGLRNALFHDILGTRPQT